MQNIIGPTAPVFVFLISIRHFLFHFYLAVLVEEVPASNNKSTASGAKYARSSVIFPQRNGLCQGEVDAVKTGPKLNLIKKKLGESGGGWVGEGYPTTLIVSSLVCEF